MSGSFDSLKYLLITFSATAVVAFLLDSFDQFNSNRLKIFEYFLIRRFCATALVAFHSIILIN